MVQHAHGHQRAADLHRGRLMTHGMYAGTRMLRVAVGDVYFMYAGLPFSEVCIHMHVAGMPAWVELVSDHEAQLYVGGKPYSAPITPGEAGLLRDERGWYTYPEGV